MQRRIVQNLCSMSFFEGETEMKIDFNSDMGESFGIYNMGNDSELLNYVSSINVACGFHAGDPVIMGKTVQLAKEKGVAVGAHPSFPDFMGFGRRYMSCTDQEIRDYIIYQVGALKSFLDYYDVELQHIKPHGALYNMAMDDSKIAIPMVETIAKLGEKLITFGFDQSEVQYYCKKKGVPYAVEGYGDREHTNNGRIIMTRTGEQKSTTEELADRAVRLIINKKVISTTGNDIDMPVQTLCVHGDTPNVERLAALIVKKLEEKEVEICKISEFI